MRRHVSVSFSFFSYRIARGPPFGTGLILFPDSGVRDESKDQEVPRFPFFLCFPFLFSVPLAASQRRATESLRRSRATTPSLFPLPPGQRALRAESIERSHAGRQTAAQRASLAEAQKAQPHGQLGIETGHGRETTSFFLYPAWWVLSRRVGQMTIRNVLSFLPLTSPIPPSLSDRDIRARKTEFETGLKNRFPPFFFFLPPLSVVAIPFRPIRRFVELVGTGWK